MTIQEMLGLVLEIIDFIIPIVFGLAFLAFLWGIYQTFIAGGADEEKRSKGRQILMFGIIGFVIMFSVWSLVSLVRSTLGFRSETRPNYPTFGAPAGNTGFFAPSNVRNPNDYDFNTDVSPSSNTSAPSNSGGSANTASPSGTNPNSFDFSTDVSPTAP